MPATVKMLRKPRALAPGATVGLAAPGGPVEPEKVEAGETWTYDELMTRAAEIAGAIRAGARPGESPVAAVVAERSFSAYAGIIDSISICLPNLSLYVLIHNPGGRHA